MRRGRMLMTAVAAGCVLVLAPTAAHAQQVDPAVDDLRGNDVTFEEDALSFEALDQLDAVTLRLQDDGGYVKVVVLAEPVTDFDTARDFADEVQAGIGGDGRVIVYTPNEVAVSSNVDSDDEIDAAERAAADTINAGRSLDAATVEAAAELGAEPGGSGGESSGIPWAFLLLVIAVPVVLLLVLWWVGRRSRARATAMSAEEVGAAESTVRGTVDTVANDLLDLADRVDLPDAPPEAREAFSRGAELFAATQDELEQADTREELEAVYPRVVEAGWHLDTARAALEGQPAPRRPEPAELFPPHVVPAPAPASLPAGEPVPTAPSAAPEPHYRQSGTSPWVTAAAMAAMAMLARRGMSTPSTRPSMDDGGVGNWSSGLPSFPSSERSRGGGGGGFGGFGGGSRSRGGGKVSPSSKTRARGMGRR